MPLEPTYDFDSYRLIPQRRLLLAHGRPIKLGSRAFDLLVVLVEQRQRTVSKQELLDTVWPDDAVEEANLAVHVLALRKILGQEAIATLPGRGYRFTRSVAEASPMSPPSVPPVPDWTDTPGRTNLPARDEPLLGREREQQELMAHLAVPGQVTLLGGAGFGKTSLAQQVAHAALPHFSEGVWWVDLAPLSDPALVAPAVARVLRSTASAERDAAAATAAALRIGPVLLVLDNAEHVLGGVIALLNQLRQQAPRATLLVTTQVTLRIPGERVMRLEPLSLPDADGLDAARRSGAVTLFEARARHLDARFVLDADSCRTVVDVCRQLDGVPLAIELAAARLPLLGLSGLQARLDERLHVLTQHRRGSVARHQTLRAALEWSHALLGEAEQRVLRRLAVFVGGFTLQTAQRLAQDARTSDWQVFEILGELVEKSLVVAEGESNRRFCLLESPRRYALERLQEAGELEAMRERHARALDAALTVPREDERRWRTPPAAPDVLASEVPNLRAALDWVKASPDDILAVSLAAGASHAFLAASLNLEYLNRVLPLRHRVTDGLPEPLVGLFWARIALASSNSAHPAGFDAAQKAADIYRRIGDPGRLYDALTWSIAIGSRQGHVDVLRPLVEEAASIEQSAWMPAARSSFQWAKHRWLLLQGRPAEALVSAQAQADLLAQAGHWATHVASGANVADCELALGHLERAEALARDGLRALSAMGIDDNIVGHVLDMWMVALTLLGRHQEALEAGHRARRLLEREGDDLRLLDTLALNATTVGRWIEAAQVAGHADAATAHRGETRWPGSEARRQQLQRRLSQALGPTTLERHLALGAGLPREQAFALAFGDEQSDGA